MTNLKNINFGINQYCGPSVLSALTGESTDRCAAVISAVSGKKEIRAVDTRHLIEALKRLRFSVEELGGGSTLFGVLNRLHNHDGMYVVLVPEHVVAVEVIGSEIFLCDNHSKSPVDIRQSARLTQRVTSVLKVVAKDPPKFSHSEVKLQRGVNMVTIVVDSCYENPEDNTQTVKGYIKYANHEDLKDIVSILNKMLNGG